MANRRTRRARRLGIEKPATTRKAAFPTPDLTGLPEGAAQLVAVMQNQPMVIGAGEVGLTALTAAQRRDLLNRIDTRDALLRVAKIHAEWDIAATTHWDVKQLQLDLLSSRESGWVAAVRAQVESGNILTAPQALVQLMRELIECESEADDRLSDDDLVHLLLSISSGQQLVSEFGSDSLTDADFVALDEKYKAMAAEDLEAVNHEVLSALGANVLFNAPRMIESYKADAFDFWYSKWAERTSDTLGDTPADTFEGATGISLDAFLRAGLVVSDAVLSGQTIVRTDDLSADSVVRDFVVRNAALDLNGYRVALAADRKRGEVKLQRFTFTRYPLLDLGDGTLLILRAQWAIERFFGDTPQYDVISAFESSGDKAFSRRFSEGIKYQFEDIVGRVLGRIAQRSTRIETVVAEPELAAEWTEKKGQEPSVCDWVLRCGPINVLIEATHHPVKASLAQGLGNGHEYDADAAKILTDRKFQQLASVMRLIRRLGWSGQPEPDAIFLPLIIVPNSGPPSSMLSELDYESRGRTAFQEFQGRTARPTVLHLSDLQLLEGLGEHLPMDVVTLLYKWRQSPLPVTLQDFLELTGLPRPIPSQVLRDSARLDTRLRT